MTVEDALDDAVARLRAAGIESARVDAEILVAHVLGAPRSQLLLMRGQDVSEGDAAELEGLVARRQRREPLAYVLGEWGFRRLALSVDPRVLVPRPETEMVVERCLALLEGVREPRVLDVGTGSGAIALAIADEHPGARVTGVDASRDALEVAGTNRMRTGLEIELREWDLFQGLPEGPWDLVVSNPPYVLPEEVATLDSEVREWEPREALVGVGATEAVVQGAHHTLLPGGALVLEIAAGDGRRVSALLAEHDFADVKVTPDLSGRDRVVEGRRA